MGYAVEVAQWSQRSTSAFSYEDLPSNDAGATFGAYHYHPNSDLSLGRQVGNFLNEHAGPEGVKTKNAGDVWEWQTRQDSYYDLPKEANSKRQLPRNFTYKPFSNERVKRELRGR